MKILSIILTALLLIPVVVCAIAVFKFYNQFDSELIPKGTVFSTAEPSIFYGFSYVVFFFLSILLNIKQKFIVNMILSGFLLLIFLVTINLVLHG